MLLWIDVELYNMDVSATFKRNCIMSLQLTLHRYVSCIPKPKHTILYKKDKT